MSKCAIVAGANGFIGSAVVKELLKNNYEVRGIINKNKNNLVKCDKVTYYDYSTIQQYQEELFTSVDFLFNFIWGGMTGSLMADYNLQINNILSSIELVKMCEKYEIKYIHAASLIEHESYNNTFNTNELPGKSHVYGAAKFAAHIFSRFYAKEHNVSYSCGLITNAYGPNEVNNRLITGTLRKIHDGVVPEFSRGEQLYDFLFITDVARAFRLIAEKGFNKNYVIGSGNPQKLRHYLELINKEIAPNMNFIYGTADVSVDYLDEKVFDSSALCDDTGFMPQVSFIDGIKETYRINYDL